jgi:uncharacterized protein involved in response to NO
MGVMTLAVMTRATLSHSGRDPTLTTAMQAIYALAVLAALARIAAPFFGDLSMAVLTASGTAWTVAFLGFVVIYGPMLLKGRRSAA